MVERLASQARDITVDMSEAIDIDLEGLQVLVHLHKRLEPRGCKVRVLGANERLRRLFEAFQLADLFIEGAAMPKASAMRSCFFGLPSPAPAAHAAPGSAVRDSVEAWLRAATVPGGELRGGDALKSFRRWVRGTAKETGSRELREILSSILGPGRVVSRTSGYVITGIQLKSAASRRKSPAAK
jgi:hypothetical protein